VGGTPVESTEASQNDQNFLAAMELVRSGAASPDEFLHLSNQDIADRSQKVAPAAVVPKVTIQSPGAAPVTIQTANEPSIPGAAPIQAAFDLDKYAGEARKVGTYDVWEKKKANIDNFRATAKRYDQLKGKVTTQNDIALATDALIIAAPGSSAGGRGMEGLRLKSLEESIPLIERFLDLPDVVLQRDKFPEDVRKRIIEITEQKSQLLENSARDVLKNLRERAVQSGQDPDRVLFDYEKQLLGSSAAATPEGQAPRGRPVTLKSGKTVVLW
jgi:hypothetical protein